MPRKRHGFLALLLVLGLAAFGLGADSYDDTDEAIVTVWSNSFPVQVAQADANRILVLKGALVSTNAAGRVIFQDGSGGAAMAQALVPTTTSLPVEIRPELLGRGKQCAAKNTGIYATIAGVTTTDAVSGYVVITARIGKR